MLVIPFDSRFPAPLNIPTWGECRCTWSDLTWAAVTVGKPNLGEVLRYGVYSWYEIVYRAFMLYANLVQTPGNRLKQSLPYRRLEPSEKGAVSYFMGLTAAKLFCAWHIGIPWLMHLDAYRNRLRQNFGLLPPVLPNRAMIYPPSLSEEV